MYAIIETGGKQYMAKVGDISRKVHSIISVKGYDEKKQDYIIINECVEG